MVILGWVGFEQCRPWLLCSGKYLLQDLPKRFVRFFAEAVFIDLNAGIDQRHDKVFLHCGELEIVVAGRGQAHLEQLFCLGEAEVKQVL